MTNIESSGAVTMPPTMGAAMRLIVSEPVPPPPHDREQTRQNHRDGHGLGPDSLHRALLDRVVQQFLGSNRAGGETRFPRVLEVDQHDHAELRRQAGQGDKPDAGRHGGVVSEQVQEPDPAREREGQRGHDQQCLVVPP